jgi:small subunit ribosomal protein S6
VRAYEVVYIFDSQLTDESIQDKLDRYHQQLSGSNGGQLAAVDHWGRRQLAFPIRKRTSGYYVVAQFTAPMAALPEFERLLKLDEELLRYMVVLHEGEPSAPMSIATRQPKRTDGGDEDDDDLDDEVRS